MRLLPPGEWHGDERGPAAERIIQAPQPELGGAALRRSREALAQQHDAALPVIAQGHGPPHYVSVCAAGVAATWDYHPSDAAVFRPTCAGGRTAVPAPSLTHHHPFARTHRSE